MNIVVRLVRSLPLLIALGVIGAIAYVAISWARSPERAKEIVIRASIVVNGVFTVLFCAGTAYAWLESNTDVLDFMATLAALFGIAVAITLICRRSFIKHHPERVFAQPRH